MDDKDLRTVRLTFPRGQTRGHLTSDCETWLTVVEQELSCQYDGYIVTVTHDSYYHNTTVDIEFSSIDDATWFRLRRKD